MNTGSRLLVLVQIMADQHHTHAPLPPAMLAALLGTVRRRRQSGDMAGARALLHALATQQPDDPRIWLALATVAETRDEQRQALERVLALDPRNELARRGLARFGAANQQRRTFEQATGNEAEAPPAASFTAISEAPAIAPAPALRSVRIDNLARGIRWPLYVVIGVAVALVLAVAVALRATTTPAAEVPTPTPPLVGAVVRLPPTPFSPPESPLAAAAAAPLQGSTPGPNTPASATPPATPTTRPPRPTAQPVLAAGDVIVRKPWHASLLRPEYAVLLDGAIGTFQPHGRFALALVAIGNDGAAPARIPGNFFALVDSQGKRYAALPAASTAYLNTYGRGQRGDLSLEENIPPGGGNVSVPLIFDVPTTARDLTLHVDDEPLGWAVGGAATAPAP